MLDRSAKLATFCRSWRKRCRLQGWLLVLLGSFLLAVPTIRTGELNEVGSAKERVEDVALTSRSESLRRSAQHGRREVIVFTSSIQARLGRDQRSEPAPPLGHRLSHELLAPMTC
jgi:hypothetical protein